MADPTLVGDLVARERRSERLALYAAELDRTYSYFDLCNTACKAGNVLRHLGVRAADRVVVDPTPAPEPVLTFLGAALLGATVAFDPDPGRECDARAVVVPVAREREFDLPGGSKLCAFGGAPERPETTHWEQEVWSENPAFPPTSHDPDDAVLRGKIDGTERSCSHADLLAAARTTVEVLGLDADSRVAVRAPLWDPRTVAAGVLAPLLAGGAVALPAAESAASADDEVDAGEENSLEPTAAVIEPGATAPEPPESVLALDSVSL